MSQIVIIGAGIAGLAAGNYLTENGFNDYVILEVILILNLFPN